MSLHVALQMDPPSQIDIDADSSFVLGLEALKRGYTLYYYAPATLSLSEGAVFATLQKMELRRDKEDFCTLYAPEKRHLAEMDVVLMRQDPPFDMGYITPTYLLEFLPARTIVVNDPKSVRDLPEKLSVMRFPDLMPPTMVSGVLADLEAFHATHGDIIVKPLYGNGGMGVIRLTQSDTNLAAMRDLFQAARMGEVMVQKFLPAIAQGDKRIILVEGKPVGALDRMVAKGSIRSNLHVGGKPVKAVISQREKEICARLEPLLDKAGIIFAGIDVIGGYLTEINATSPTGLQEINRFDKTCLEALIWDAIEARLAKLRASAS